MSMVYGVAKQAIRTELRPALGFWRTRYLLTVLGLAGLCRLIYTGLALAQGAVITAQATLAGYAADLLGKGKAGTP
jgi:hypothetical protein